MPWAALLLPQMRYRPRAEVIADDVLAPADRDMVRERLQKFAERHIAGLAEPLMELEEAEGLEGITRGIAYRLAENYGVLPRDGVAEDVKQLSQEDRAKLRALGVRFGAFTLFLPALLKPAATDLRLVLWWLEQQKAGSVSGDVPAAPANGLTSAAARRRGLKASTACAAIASVAAAPWRVLHAGAPLRPDPRPRLLETALPRGAASAGGCRWRWFHRDARHDVVGRLFWRRV